MSFSIPPPELISIPGIIGAFIIFGFIMNYTRKKTHSKQSWIPALIFAIMVEIAISVIFSKLNI
jgi:glycopeptide antibiotics resistance protein